MKKVMIDTNVYSAFKAGEPEVVKWFTLPETILVCTPVLIWIAASALQHGAAVCSFDSHFSHIDGLIVCTPS